MVCERRRIVLNVNNFSYEVEAAPHETLLYVLREKLNFRGAKEACDGGECGACTVLMDGRPVLACLILAWDGEGRKITTVEGLAQEGKLSPLQEAFLAEGAVQCGFCTPGMLLSAQAFLDTAENPTEEEIREALAGNLCRCTGYVKAIAAVKKLAKEGREKNNGL